MDRIVEGVHAFQEKCYPAQRELFESLARKQQKPQALFITCSDSRVNPNLITQTEPGDLFLLRNAGNIIPPYGAASGGESATVEYAIAVLGIKNIIICGHSQCGAMKALLRAESHKDLPAVSDWFKHAEATRCIVREKYPHLEGTELDVAATQENVMVQLNNLSTHPLVTARLARNELCLYGWYYDIGSGRVLEFHQDVGDFVDLDREAHPALPLPVCGMLNCH